MERNKVLKNQKFFIMLALFTLGGILGFIYEEFFYRIDLGYWVKRGTTFGPWIPIYSFGGILIILLTDKYIKKPYLVFLMSVGISGILEFVTGYVLYHVFNTRLWDYNVEIWNWGNIGGYICLRSVLFFGCSGILMQYVLHPMMNKIAELLGEKKFKIYSCIFSSIYIIDIIVSEISLWILKK